MPSPFRVPAGYQSMTDNLCYGGHGGTHAGADPGPVSGHNPLRILYVVKQSLEAENYAKLLRVHSGCSKAV